MRIAFFVIIYVRIQTCFFLFQYMYLKDNIILVQEICFIISRQIGIIHGITFLWLISSYTKIVASRLFTKDTP